MFLPSLMVPEAVHSESVFLCELLLTCLSPGARGCSPLGWPCLAAPWRRLGAASLLPWVQVCKELVPQPRAHPHLGLDVTGEGLSSPLRGHLGSRSLSLGLSVPLLLPMGPKGHLPAGRLLLALTGLPILTTCNDSLVPVSSIPSITNQKGIQG